MQEMTKKEFESNVIYVEEINGKVKKLKTLIADFNKKDVFGEEEFSEEIEELQKDIENDIDNLCCDFDLDSAGESGRYIGYGWSTTDEDAEYPMDLYTKYTERGLMDVIIKI